MDGKKHLTPSDNDTVVLEDKTTPNARATTGTWELSDKGDHHAIKLGDEDASYERITPQGVGMCIPRGGKRLCKTFRAGS